jgi:hypothetical protein
LASSALSVQVRDLAAIYENSATTTQSKALAMTEPITEESSESIRDYARIIRSLLEVKEFTSLLEPGASETGVFLQQFHQILRKAAPNVSHDAAGFPKLWLALRFALTGTAYGIAAGDSPARLYVIIKRECQHPGMEPDITLEDLKSTIVIRDVLAAGKPTLQFESLDALTTVTAFLSDNPVTGTVADLLEALAGRQADIPAKALRQTLGLFVAAGILSGDPAVPFMERPLAVDPRFPDYDAMVGRLEDLVIDVLEARRWPVDRAAIQALLPPLS